MERPESSYFLSGPGPVGREGGALLADDQELAILVSTERDRTGCRGLDVPC